ncbi:transporter [Ganoderma sinense ZZ0214-1]|uniref:Transporter n=1 Tax=Ganoderma sinense ZZ0214-1 TaxID=1077348 RepID=A0A2G8RU56_9APHY|nr:transporter [Ganoderma sinense ZZ0214-1]
MATPNPPRIMTTSTPVRDRSYRTDLASSASNSPASMRPAASFSTPTPSNGSGPPNANPAVPTTQPLTVEGLLANNGNSISAALDAAVNERNALSAQNTQLWKLIEKQRSGYNHLMKEVERIRGERDLYRNRLQTIGENTDALLRAHRAKEKVDVRDGPLRPFASQSQLKPSESNPSTSTPRSTPVANDPRVHMIRTHSEELPARTQQLSTSRSFDPLQPSSSNVRSTPERKGSSGTLNSVPRSESPVQRDPSHNYLSASQAPSVSHAPSPLSISSVGLAAEVQATPRKSPPLSQSPTEDALPSALTAIPARSDSLSVSSTPTPSPSMTRPAKSISPSELADPVLGAWQPPQGTPRSAGQPPQPQVQLSTPATPESTVSTPRAQVPESSRSLNDSAPNGRSSPPRPSPISNSTSQQQPVTITLNGESRLNARLVGASRDSQISLPEEARRYYATMSSPAGSPGSKLTFSSSNPNSPLRQEDVVQDSSAHSGSNGVAALNGTASRFVGLGIPDSAELPTRTLSAEARGRPNGHVPGAGSQRAASVEDGAEFLDMDDEDSAYDFGVNGVSNGSSEGGQHVSYPLYDETEETLAAHKRGKTKNARPPGPAVEDFPLPPGTTSVSPPPRPQERDTSPPASIPAVQVHMGTPSRQGSVAESVTLARESRPSMQSTSDSAAYQLSLASSQTLVQDQPPPSPFPLPLPANPPTMSFRALPLLSEDLPYTDVVVANSSIRPNDRGKEVLSFTIAVEPGRGKDGWKVEKLYSDVLSLDGRVRAAVGRTASKKLAALPEGRLWRDHAPAKVDQRKAALETYLRSLVALPVKNKDEIIAFFTSDIMRETQKPVSQAGYKEGYLTKRGKNFGGWKTRYFVLQGPSLEYYESRGGTHLGSITITNAQIGRQQRQPEKREGDEDNEYRHAFLIIESRKGPGGSTARHVLCAESDEERDSWVEELVRYVSGQYNEEQIAMATNGSSPISAVQQNSLREPRSSTSSNPPTDILSTPMRRVAKDVIARGPAVPLSQLPQHTNNAKLFNTPVYSEDHVSSSPAKSSLAPSDGDAPMSSSLPVSSPLVEEPDITPALNPRSNSELGHYPDIDQRAIMGRSPEQQKRNKMKRMSMKPPSIPERSPSPEKDHLNTPRVDTHGKVKISGPMNGTPIPAGYKFGAKEAPPPEQPPPMPPPDRREKTKSRSFKNWGFGKSHGSDKTPANAAPAYIPRAVFGVSLEESLDVAQIASLPAIVFRCIQYLEAKKAEQEEGIYRLSGSSAVIKSLKDRFNAEGDVDLLASDEYWDPHAIAGLLKTFLRELPASILTRDLHLRFLSVIDFVDPQERISELSRLISALPIANYSLLRALTAHLILIVQNANINKMTMRNVGIVFSPTLGIPAGVFSLMLGEFKRVFNVDGILEEAPAPTDPQEAETRDSARRNSQHYSEAAADQMLGLTGRALPVQQEDAQSDEGDDIVEESGTEATTEDAESVLDSSAGSNSTHGPQSVYADRVGTPESSQRGQSPAAGAQAAQRSRAAQLAATRGLSVTTDKTSRRHSRMIGLPASPRPPGQHAPAASDLNMQGIPGSPRTGDSRAGAPRTPASDSPLRAT